MKRIVILLLSLIMSTSFVSAQSDCIMCGTWKGEYSNRPPSGKVYNFQQQLKIRKVGDNYRIRMRTIFLNEGKVMSEGICKVTSSNDYEIRFDVQAYQKNQYDSEKGLYYNVFTSYSIEYDDDSGVLYLYEEEVHTAWYMGQSFLRNDEYINRKHDLIVTLYNEEDGW